MLHARDSQQAWSVMESNEHKKYKKISYIFLDCCAVRPHFSFNLKYSLFRIITKFALFIITTILQRAVDIRGNNIWWMWWLGGVTSFHFVCSSEERVVLSYIENKSFLLANSGCFFQMFCFAWWAAALRHFIEAQGTEFNSIPSDANHRTFLGQWFAIRVVNP